MQNPASLFVPAVIATLFAGGSPAGRPRPTVPPAAIVAANDNRAAAGTMRGDTLVIALEVGTGEWHPYGPNGPGVPLVAFGEEGKLLQTPGPMIRVRAGTRIRASVHNTEHDTLVVHGLASRHAVIQDTLVVPPGQTRDASFAADDEGHVLLLGEHDPQFVLGPGLRGRPAQRRDRRRSPHRNTEAGPRVRDSVDAAPARGAGHRCLPSSTASSPSTARRGRTRSASATRRATPCAGDSSTRRPTCIRSTCTASTTASPRAAMRTATRSTGRPQQRMAVTELLDEGTTMNMAWYADRPGGWIFHCHLNWHVVPNPAIGAGAQPDSVRERILFSAPDMKEMDGMPAMANHSETGMGGLVLRMDITPSADWHPYAGPRERLHLFIQSDSQPGDSVRRFGYALARDGEQPAPNAVQWPGPPIILHQGQPTSITVVNRTLEPSQVHWHGLEIDSYFDGVAGLSSNGAMVSPMIMPRDSFVVTLTPPRAGSFMYHTHINDIRQQSHGLYGPIVVLSPGEKWDPSTDLIFQTGTSPADRPILNGSAAPPALTLHAGKPYRIRLMNISLDTPFNEFWLTAANGMAALWTALAKDGFDLPAWQRRTVRARQRVSIGETYDFRVTLAAPGEYEMTGRRGSEAVYATQHIHVVP